MSKRTTQPLSDNTRKLIIIIAIALVAIIIMSVALALILKPVDKTPADESTDNSDSSTLTIKNGDFLYSSSNDTGYPRTAANWTKYAYKDGTDFQSITSHEKSVMGIINLDEWDDVVADLADEDVTLSNNLAVHETIDATDRNIYMIYNKEATTASILSDTVSVASGASVRISAWVNLTGMAEGSKAVIMIQKSTVSAKEENWYAYDREVVEKDTDANGWQQVEFYIFNRESSTKYIRVSVGLGDVYTGDTAEGLLLVDDIEYETKTANDYRQKADSGIEATKTYSPFKIIENDDITAEESDLYQLHKGDKSVADPTTYSDFEGYRDGEGEDGNYLPFTNKDDFKDGERGFLIYKVSSHKNGDIATMVSDEIELEYSSVYKDNFHISFWVRVKQENNHQATQANVFVQNKDEDGEWKDLDSGSITKITTSQEVDTDTNCGWVKYDIYLKPAANGKVDTVRILFALGNRDGYSEKEIRNGLAPRGSLFVTSPTYEQISDKDYNNASTGTNVRKFNLTGDSASTTVTNGSFSNTNNIGDEPANWTPVFAGDNAIYKDGKGDTLDEQYKEASRVRGSGVDKSFANTAVDDAQKNVLNITTDNTNFGYISNNITLSARTIYVFSVLAKSDTLAPHIYLIDTSKDREEAIAASIESDNADAHKSLDQYFDYKLGDVVDETAGWVRYYLVFVTKNETTSVRLALFNGAIDAVTEEDGFSTGTIYYDSVKMRAIGTYSFVEDEDNEEATNYLVKFSANEGYEDAIDVLTGEDNDKLIEGNEIFEALGEGAYTQPTQEEWEEMTLIPEDADDDDDGDDDEETTAPKDVDWGLLMSVISSVILVAALLIVFVIKLFQRKGPRAA